MNIRSKTVAEGRDTVYNTKFLWQMKTETESSSASRPRLWSNLPDDIIYLIMHRIHYVGQIHFRGVCKTWPWEANVRGVKPAHRLPWIPHQRKYTIETTITFTDTKSLASKHSPLFLLTYHPSTIPSSNQTTQLNKGEVQHSDISREARVDSETE